MTDGAMSSYPELSRYAERAGVLQDFQPGCRVVEQDRPAQAAYSIMAGLVRLPRTDADGRESVVDVCGRFSLLGLDSVVLEEPSPVSAVVLSPCRLCCLPRRTLVEAAQAPPLLLDLLRLVCRSSIANSVRIARLTSSTAEERALEFLENLGLRSGGAKRVQLPFRDCDFAAYLGVTPPHLSRLLARLQHKGVVTRQGGWFLRPERIEPRNGVRP